MSLDNLLTFVFAVSNEDSAPGTTNYKLVERLLGILGKDSDERAYQACRYIDQVSQFFDHYEFPPIAFAKGTRVATTKSNMYSDFMISEGDLQLQRDSLSFALTTYSAGVAAALDEDLGRAYSRRARALFHAQRFEDCSVDIDQALKYHSQLCDIEICFLNSMKRFCNHRTEYSNPFTYIEEYNIMNNCLRMAETSQQLASRLVQALEMMMNKHTTRPSQTIDLPAHLAHPTPCQIPAKSYVSTQMSTIPLGTCRIPTHMPALQVEAEPYPYTECQWLLMDMKRRKLPREAPVLQETNNENSCFTSAVRFAFEGQEEVAIATRDIFAGELIAVERPWASVVNPVEHCTFCDHCKQRCLTLIPCPHCSLAMFCGEQCRTAAWCEHHGEECAILRALFESVQDWQQLEVATLALRMFFTAWRESNRSVDFMRFRLSNQTAWNIGLPSTQDLLRTTKIHLEAVQTMAPCSTTSLKGSLAAAGLTQLLRQHSEVFNDPEGPGECTGPKARTSTPATKLRHSIQPSLLKTRDLKKFGFWAKLLDDDPELFYESGLAEALNFGCSRRNQQIAAYENEVKKCFSRSAQTPKHSEEKGKSQADDAKNNNSESERNLEQEILDKPVALKDNSVGIESIQDADPSSERRDMRALVGKTGEVTAPNMDLAARDDTAAACKNVHLPLFDNVLPCQLEGSMECPAHPEKKLISKEMTNKKSICDMDPVSVPKTYSADKTRRPVVGHSKAGNICKNTCEEVVLPLLGKGQRALSKVNVASGLRKTEETVCTRNIAKKIYEIVLQKTGAEQKSSQVDGFSSAMQVAAAGHTKKTDENETPEKDYTSRVKIIGNESKKDYFETSCDFDEAIVKVRLIEMGDKEQQEERDNACAKNPQPDINQGLAALDLGTLDTMSIELENLSFPGHSMQTMKVFVKKALDLMQNMSLCDKASGSMTEENTIRIFCDHLKTLMNDYELHIQPDLFACWDSAKDETCSTESNDTETHSDESNDGSYVTAGSQPRKKISRKHRAQVRLAGRARTYNCLKNLVDSQTLESLLESMWRRYHLVADGNDARQTGLQPPPPYKAKRFQLTHEPIVSKFNDADRRSGIVCYKPQLKKIVSIKLTPQGIAKLVPDPFTFSLALFDESKQPLSILVDVNIVPTIYVDSRVFAVRLPHLAHAPGSSSSKRMRSVAGLISLIQCAGLSRQAILAERTINAKREQALRSREMLAYSAAQSAKFASVKSFVLPALWDDVSLKEADLGLFYTRNDGPVAAIDDFTDVYFKECFSVLGPRTNLPPVDDNFLFAGQSGRQMAALVKTDFFHHLLLTKTVLNDPQGWGEATPWFACRQQPLTPEDIYYDPTSLLKKALMPWYYDFFDVIYERRLRAVSSLLMRSPSDNLSFLKGKVTREMVEFRHRMKLPHPLLGQPVLIRESLAPPPASNKLEERMAFVATMMLSYYHLASKASRIMECTYSIDETDEGGTRPPRPTNRTNETCMNPNLTMNIDKLEFTMIGLDSYRPFGSAIYSTTTYLPHSCDPNVFALSAGGDVGVWAAMRHIRKGERLTVSYGPHISTMSRYNRKAKLRQDFGFDCDCNACEDRNEPKDSAVPIPELVCFHCGTLLGSKKTRRRNLRTLICPKCKQRNDVNLTLRRLGEIRRFVDHVRLSLYGRPSSGYNFLGDLGVESAFIYDHVQRPNQLTFALEEVIKMALIQSIGNFVCVE